MNHNTREYLNELLERRIIILDGGMGMLVQSWRFPNGEPLSESDCCGNRFAAHPVSLKGCVDLLCLTKPEIISGIHEAYLEAGADIIETCSLNSTSIGLESYGLKDLSYEISAAAAALARKAADKYSSARKKRFAAGSIGPTSKSASITPDLDEPEKRAVSWDELEAAYYDNARGLLDGGADIIIIETIFDTLNAKAAQFAVNRLAAERGIDIPVIVSATVSESGRLLTGQDLKAFCASVLPGNPWAVGLNCSFGAAALTPYLEELAAAAPCPLIAYPNAGLPDKDGIYSDSPEIMASQMEKWFQKKLVNIAGGCCGSTPLHIAAIAASAQNYKPRTPPPIPEGKVFLAGTRTLELEREKLKSLKDASSSAAFTACLEAGDYEGAIDEALTETENGADILFIRPDKAPNPMLAAQRLIFLANCFSELAGLPIGIESASPIIVEAALKCTQGRALVKCNGNEKIMGLAIKYGAEYLPD
jgi:5-methyltetrahydrofolate--homocysteine methyltransferase